MERIRNENIRGTAHGRCPARQDRLFEHVQKRGKHLMDAVREDVKVAGVTEENLSSLPACIFFFQRHELTGDKRERETGS